jgi:glycosyltransferase involved in cell wall biosynthesis
MNYILITPCRNEENNLPKLAHSITAQTIKPLLWIIVDDKSTDSTPSIIRIFEQGHQWIKGLHLTETGEYMGFHYSRVCNQGFDYAINLCSEKKISYEYIALVDADNILEKKYFEKLIHEFQKNPKLGIASGINVFIDIDTLSKESKLDDITENKIKELFDSNIIRIQPFRDDVPIGSARIWRKECFEKTGRYLFTHAPDSVSNVKAKMLGWSTKRFPNAMVLEREGLIAQGLWQGYKKRGSSDYYIWFPLYLAILKSIALSIEKPFYIGIAYLYGYLASHFIRANKLVDNEVKIYYQKIRPNQLRVLYSRKIKKIFLK